MTIAISPSSLRSRAELYSGDRMTRAEFHRVYEQTAKDFKAELIGGIVYVASPLRLRHGKNHLALGSVLFAYECATPGTESGDNTTVLLGEESEPQPDLFLRILPEFGGKTTTTDTDYVSGPPELVVEIAHSSRSIDLHSKREDYLKYGVAEYLVACVEDQQLRWFDLSADQEISVPSDGTVRSHSFPGLWIDARAVFTRDFDRLMSVLKDGLATPEHGEFGRRLSHAK
jgi:Uma2 family endonuclease